MGLTWLAGGGVVAGRTGRMDAGRIQAGYRSRTETLHNSWLRCITRDTVGRPDSISTKDLMEKTHQPS